MGAFVDTSAAVGDSLDRAALVELLMSWGGVKVKQRVVWLGADVREVTNRRRSAFPKEVKLVRSRHEDKDKPRPSIRAVGLQGVMTSEMVPWGPDYEEP